MAAFIKCTSIIYVRYPPGKCWVGLDLSPASVQVPANIKVKLNGKGSVLTLND